MILKGIIVGALLLDLFKLKIPDSDWNILYLSTNPPIVFCTFSANPPIVQDDFKSDCLNLALRQSIYKSKFT